MLECLQIIGPPLICLSFLYENLTSLIMAEWEHKEATWIWDSGQRRFVVRGNVVYWNLRLWVSDNGAPSLIDKEWILRKPSPKTKEPDEDSFNDEVEKINKEFSEILPLQLKFTEWLDLQTKGGWEVFKISRTDDKTWCVFRRKTE